MRNLYIERCFYFCFIKHGICRAVCFRGIFGCMQRFHFAGEMCIRDSHCTAKLCTDGIVGLHRFYIADYITFFHSVTYLQRSFRFCPQVPVVSFLYAFLWSVCSLLRNWFSFRNAPWLSINTPFIAFIGIYKHIILNIYRKVNKNFLTSNSNGVIIVSDRVIKHARVNHTLE